MMSLNTYFREAGQRLLKQPIPGWVVALVTFLAAAVPAHSADSEPIDFNRDIRPILSDRCFHCHGPDSVSREADLRLDQESGLLATVEPGNFSHSKLINRIRHADADQRMPPPDSGRSLSEHEITLLERWVKEGAQWQKHWSFIPPVASQLPVVEDEVWVRNPIDRFVLAELETHGLKPSARAAKTTLIRRVTFDLTGLPPTLDEIDTFLADDSPDAYEKLVDRLLKSPHYGERMAMDWLDAARYADSHGYSLDRRRVMWPWRDWVIQAYNDNMPFDQFTIQQIAGDLLPAATTAQQVATGFNRNHPIQSEGGVINEEYRVETVVDRVETTAAVFLGLTMGCARCHDHKYEPISQRDFYSFYAFFNNVPETAHVGNRDNDADKPFIKAPSVMQAEQTNQLSQMIAETEKQLLETSKLSHPEPVEQVWVDDELPEGAQPFGNGGGPQEFRFVTGKNHPVLSGDRSSQRSSTGRGQHGFQGAHPLLVSGDARLFVHVYLDEDDPPQQIMLQWHGPKGWEHRAYWGANLINWGTENSPSRRAMGPLPETGKWVRLEVDANQIGLPPGSEIDGWAFTQFDGTVYWDKAGITSTLQSPLEKRLAALRAELNTLQSESPTVMVMAEAKPRRPTFVLARGQYDQPLDDEVQPAIPAVLGHLNIDQANPEPINRLALARWMVSPDNPLTARVTVNRFWQACFGTGLVSTPEDFGAQGALPSHPELLDWLAMEFVRSDWNVKALQKLIVMSATYQQSSRVTPELLQRDPNNRLLARGPRFRLPAEMIRDSALAISGLLVDRLGGPSVRPYQPPGLWDDVVYGNVPRFQQDHGDKLYRRSLYTYWKRSVPPPNLQIFDAPSREACVLQRSRTNTPLAALVLMNDPTFVEAARKLAERAILEGGPNDEQRLQYMFRLSTSRPPKPDELHLMNVVLIDSRNHYRKNSAAAEKLMSIGESAARSEFSVVETAAMTAVANAILGTDEAITKN